MRAVFGKFFLKENPTIVIFLIAFAIGFGVCYLCCRLYQKSRVLDNKLFSNSKFIQVQISDTIIYTCCTISGIIWGIVAVNADFDNLNLGRFFILCLMVNLGAIFILFAVIEFIFSPLPAEAYEAKKNPVAIRALKVLFTISFYLDVFLLCYLLGKKTFLDNLFEYGLAVVVPFFILWGISYIAFGSEDPFFTFKYKPNQKQKKDDAEYIDTEIVE